MTHDNPFKDGISKGKPFDVWINPNLTRRFICIDCNHAFESKEKDNLCSVCKLRRIGRMK